jgi:hypothetical protein
MRHKASAKPPRSPEAKARSRMRVDFIGITLCTFLIPWWFYDWVESRHTSAFIFLIAGMALWLTLFIRLVRSI